MSDLAIRVENLSKKYRIGGRQQGYKRFTETLMDTLAAPVRRLRSLGKPTPPEDSIWALKDVSFEVERGEVLGIIGRNGAGKTTLLKMLSRITEPTEGRAEIHGRAGSLLEVGTGFHPELTGRENVYLSGVILGMKRAEIEHKFDEIVDFSGVDKFIDTPFKRYSSGMRVRLAFAVAAHLDPEILLIDEVLAVGDVEFQKKCLGKMRSVTGEGRTVLFVSHNMAAIRNLCPRTLLLDSGVLVSDTDTDGAIAQYLDRNLVQGAVVSWEEFEGKVEGKINRDNPSIRFREVALIDQEGLPRNAFQSDEEIRVSITYECLTTVYDLRVVAQIVDEENRPILTTQSTDASSDGKRFYRREPGAYESFCIMPPNTFGEKRFYVSVQLLRPKAEHLVLKKIMGFDVSFQGYSNVQYAPFENSFVRPRLIWETHLLSEYREMV